MLTSYNIEHRSVSDCQSDSRNQASSSNISRFYQPDSFYYSPYSTGFFRHIYRPYLRLEYDPSDSDNLTPVHHNVKYIKIRVKNVGRSIATNCRAEVRILIPQNVDSNLYPSKEWKILSWGQQHDLSDLNETTFIRPNHEELVHVVFAHPDFPRMDVNTKNPPTRYASFSMQSRIRPGGENINIPDSFIAGDFEIEVRITSEQAKTKGRFSIHVETNHMNLSMTALPCSKTEKIKQLLKWNI
jgi:hypothetical protein